MTAVTVQKCTFLLQLHKLFRYQRSKMHREIVREITRFIQSSGDNKNFHDLLQKFLLFRVFLTLTTL